MQQNCYKLFTVRKPSCDWLLRTVSNFGSVGVRLGCAFAVAASCMATASPVAAQTVIYDGSQPLNFFSASRLTDDLALTNNPNDDTRNGVVDAGADPAVLEIGDAAWFRSSGRRMNNIDPAVTPDAAGAAGVATGVDGTFMTDNGTVGGDLGSGAGYVLYDANTTTGPQALNISVYYNDATPNDGANTNGANDSGGSVSVRVWGVTQATDASNPWADDDFTFLAGSGGTAAFLSAGNHREVTDTGDDPVVENLLTAGSFYDPNTMEVVGTEILPSADWQELSFTFDAGTGYDWLIIAVGGVGQSDIGDERPGNRYGFDNISFEAAATDILLGDVNQDEAVNFLDISPFIARLSSGIFLAEADIDENGSVNFLDISPFIAILSGS